MEAHIAHRSAQRLLRQRNWLALLAAGLAVTSLVAITAATTQSREIVLVPVTGQSLTLSSAGVADEYLELVTRDTALMLLNRSPEGLDYWMEQILKLADPGAHGRLKSELVKIVSEQRGSDIAQAFVIRSLSIDPKELRSEVSGTLKTFVGAQVIASEERKFVFRWSYSGLRLALTGFAQVPTDADQKNNQKTNQKDAS
ncbi:type IV conjugative transfer system protein TraE [Sphingorhabdus sp. EL138]|uniref:type IV conjugative transfer system protein TraE n=1 Tax=Sphingorhabdus sp. EL138 TaxID=2073156 RepID=UPI000D69E960|nr:type IV conjugative transfer system protein TraE [Sphingorhabdus sp. EL138]